jgi:tetratricopeptide (TPR) repeat protein
MGQICQQQRKVEEARRDYLKSIEADSLYVKPYVELARLAFLKRKWQDVIDITDRALDLDPLDFCEAYLFNSLANYSMDRLENAEKSARQAVRLDGLHRFPQVHLILANILYLNQDVAGAVEQLHAFLKYAPAAANADEVRARLQDLEREAGAVSHAPRIPDHQGP